MEDEEFSSEEIQHAMKVMSSAQIDRAEKLAHELRECGHDISYLDLLDALASTSLRLEFMLEALGNVASRAYFEALTRDE